ncbi:MAG: PD40 domain-containing protein [Candidatus Krumholzibacteriota bacterium]|nr:PD40 domain-containing protein [Candidatus Krumholzibacteriota bacterium]
MRRPYRPLLVAAIACVAMTGSGCDESAVEPADSLLDWLIVYPMIDAGPAWSPDGSTIAYHHFGVVDVDPLDGTSRIDEDLAGLWLIDIDGGDPRRISPIGRQPAWSPDGSRIAFVHDRDLFTIAADGSDPRQLTTGGGCLWPDWSSDGSRIACSFGGIRIFDAGTGEELFRKDGPHGISWSPDDRLFVFVGDNEWGSSQGALWTYDMTSDVMTPLGTPHGYYWELAWSPDGSRIACAHRSNDASAGCDIWIVDAGGGNPLRLTDGGGGEPCWSPDGSRIAYVRYAIREYTPANGTIWIMNADGTGQRQLTASPVGP